MEFIRKLEENRNMVRAKEREYHDVVFPHGFRYFLNALEIEGLRLESDQRVVINGKHRWCNHVKDGGLLFETSHHPMMANDKAGDIVVRGSVDTLAVFDDLLKLHEAEFDSKDPKDIVVKSEYHNELMPDIWDGMTIKPEVLEKLSEIADEFVKFLKMEDFDYEDVVITGSAVNYNWTPASDIDVHFIVDIEGLKAKHGDIVREFFDTKRSVWNDLHDIEIYGHSVELYIQDKDEPHFALGMYSIMDGKWIKEPPHKEPTIDDAAVKAKAAELMKEIDNVTENCDKASAVEALMKRIKKIRQSGLEADGEFSVENLAFKVLRNNGYLEKLVSCRTKSFDRALSIEDEEWNFE